MSSDQEKEEHPLSREFTFWWTISDKNLSAANYEDSLKPVEEFWQTYSFIERAITLPPPWTLHFFEKGVKPVWEDPANAQGARLTIKLIKRDAASYIWEQLLIALIGHHFGATIDGKFVDLSDDITGIVITYRNTTISISTWNRTSSDKTLIDNLKLIIGEITKYHEDLGEIEYRPHHGTKPERSKTIRKVDRPRYDRERDKGVEKEREIGMGYGEGREPHRNPESREKSGGWSDDKEQSEVKHQKQDWSSVHAPPATSYSSTFPTPPSSSSSPASVPPAAAPGSLASPLEKLFSSVYKSASPTASSAGGSALSASDSQGPIFGTPSGAKYYHGSASSDKNANAPKEREGGKKWDDHHSNAEDEVKGKEDEGRKKEQGQQKRKRGNEEKEEDKEGKTEWKAKSWKAPPQAGRGKGVPSSEESGMRGERERGRGGRGGRRGGRGGRPANATVGTDNKEMSFSYTPSNASPYHAGKARGGKQ
eukprot:MONOS_12228.1-p1 / transcript=MONOS_12228.1 / gene=MONOS_12228 / organism=Monocercomonoides_exilis_PA203 / gene_product=Translation initiation factor 4E like protein / transcript_product=Translation initiation factor 4E like protein / location=Mono_scaffold00662:22855-24584(-) / protein_length=480 / sequence_SO=supercontig / SO=protein_coding / is_pseudo=false